MSRNIALDVLKLSMAFMVIGMHTGFLGDLSLLGQYLTSNGLFRIAVPIFLIINGFYFFPVLSKNIQFNWLKRILVLYAVWMMFYSSYWFFVPDFSVAGLTKFVNKIIIGYYHLWYISGMIGAAILLIILRKYNDFILTASIIFTFITGVLIQYLGNYHVFEGTVLDTFFNYNWFHRNMILFSYPFFCVGYLINKHSLHKIITINQAVIISVVGFFILLAESYINYYQVNRDGGFDNLFSLLLVCPFIFISFIKLNIIGKSKNIALYSSAIYFIHAFFINIVPKYIEIDATALTLLVILLSTFTSYFIVKLNNKLKIIL